MLLSVVQRQQNNQQSGLPLTIFDNQELGESGPPLTCKLWKYHLADTKEETQLRMAQENKSGQLFKNEKT